MFLILETNIHVQHIPWIACQCFSMSAIATVCLGRKHPGDMRRALVFSFCQICNHKLDSPTSLNVRTEVAGPAAIAGATYFTDRSIVLQRAVAIHELETNPSRFDGQLPGHHFPRRSSGLKEQAKHSQGCCKYCNVPVLLELECRYNGSYGYLTENRKTRRDSGAEIPAQRSSVSQ